MSTRELLTEETIYFDWDHNKVTTLTGSTSNEVVEYPSLDTLLDTLDQPTVLVGEATFESFDLAKRWSVIQRVEAEGHTLLTTPNRKTAKHRNELGLDKTDANDAITIRDIALNTAIHLKRPNVRTDEWAERSQAANKELRILRQSGQKDGVAEAIIPSLPDPKALPEDIRVALVGSNGKYSKTIVAAVAVAAKHTNSRREFERLVGLYVHGYPSQFRSDLHYHGFRHANKRGATWRSFRKAIRWLYHEVSLQQEGS